MTILLLALVFLRIINCGHSVELNIGTWNTYDVYYGQQRDARRDYFFENRASLFGDLDVFCTQESHTYASISNFTDNFADVFPYSYYFDNPSTSPYQSCSADQINAFWNASSPIYECSNQCANDKLPNTFSYIFCLWRCFGELRDNTTGVATRANNPELFDLGRDLEISRCLTCLWKSYFVEGFGTQWADENDTDVMFDDIITYCASADNPFDYKVNEGMILWSKYEFDSVEYVELDEAVFIARGYIKATISGIAAAPLTILCTHLETPTINGIFGSSFASMIQENIDKGVNELSDITENQVAQLVTDISAMDNVILLGDLNIGINSRVDIYDSLLSGAGLQSVFGTNAELSAAINCSRCAANPFTTNQEIVDHILVKGVIYDAVDSSTRFLDGTYNTSGGVIPLSDHYGIKTTFVFPTGQPTTSTVVLSTEETEGTVDSGEDSVIRYVVHVSYTLVVMMIHTGTKTRFGVHLSLYQSLTNEKFVHIPS
eukprot:155927_1